MKIHVVTVGKIKDKHLSALNAHYEKRIPYYLPFEATSVKEGRGHEGHVKATEGAALRAAIPDRAQVVLLDERGVQMTSIELADQLQSWMNQSLKHVAFVIGGAAGLDPDWLGSDVMKLALSAMTLPHEIAHLITLEQIYRACTILRGEPYHKA